MGFHCIIFSTFLYFKICLIKSEIKTHPKHIQNTHTLFLCKQIFPDVGAKPVARPDAVRAKKHWPSFPLASQDQCISLLCPEQPAETSVCANGEVRSPFPSLPAGRIQVSPFWGAETQLSLCPPSWRAVSTCSVLFSRFSPVRLSATPWTVACQAPLSMGILQARILEWVAMSSSRGSSQPRNQTQVSCIVGRFFTV